MDVKGAAGNYSFTTDNGQGNGNGRIFVEWIMPNTVTYSCYVTSIGRGFSRLDITYNNVGTREKSVYYHIRTVDIVEITIPNKLFLTIDDSYTFNPIIRDVGTTEKLTWQSVDPSIATVSDDGKLEAVGTGVTTIICSAGNGVTAQCLVFVTSKLAGEKEKADINGDGKINVLDVTSIIDIILNK